MTATEQQTKERKGVPADLLKIATTAPKGMDIGKMKEVQPFERDPAISVGKEFEVGMTIFGWYAGSVVVPTPRSKYAKENTIHYVRTGNPAGSKLGIWSKAELKAFFEDMALGTPVSITYKELGENADGNEQHYFSFLSGEQALNS